MESSRSEVTEHDHTLQATALVHEAFLKLVAVQVAALDPQQNRGVELRFFGRLTMDETAKVLHISPATVGREWTLARAWSFAELQRSTP